MRNKLYLVIGFLLGVLSISKSQSINNQVINSAGGGGPVGTTSVEVYYNIGETVINTIQGGTNTVTQGFLQPDVLGHYGLTVTTAVNHITCFGKHDGAIILTPTVSGLGSSTTVSYTYSWTPSSLCPTNDCSSVSGLSGGDTVSVVIIANYGSTSDTAYVNKVVINDNQSPCLLEIYNGVTPNGDGKNDFFYLGNIDQYPNNVVTIYNRWGGLISRIEKYDNMNNSWKGTNLNNVTVPSGTYFYVIDLGDGNIKPIKGWLELLNK